MGLGFPERFADGAAKGRPHSLMISRAAGWAGIRTATVSMPPVVAAGTFSLLGKIMVKGPGQKASASSSASLGQWATKGYKS